MPLLFVQRFLSQSLKKLWCIIMMTLPKSKVHNILLFSNSSSFPCLTSYPSNNTYSTRVRHAPCTACLGSVPLIPPAAASHTDTDGGPMKQSLQWNSFFGHTLQLALCSVEGLLLHRELVPSVFFSFILGSTECDLH
jgi:hypothetical protein